MSQETNQFTFFINRDAEATDYNRKAYRAYPKKLLIYLEGSNKPYEVCNISVSGISFKLNCVEEQKSMRPGMCIILHLFSDVHDQILTLPIEVLRVEQNTCSCFFLNCPSNNENILDTLILEIQKHDITQRKEAYRQELAKEELRIQELHKTPLASIFDSNTQNIQSDNIIEIPSEALYTSSQNKKPLQKNTKLKPLSQNPKEPLPEPKKPLPEPKKLLQEPKRLLPEPKELLQEPKEMAQNANDLTVKSDNLNRKAYRAHPKELWVYLESDKKPHKVHNISTAGICFEFNSTEEQKNISTGQSLVLYLSSDMHDSMLRMSVQIIRMGQDTCSCFFPVLPLNNETVLDKLILEMQKNEIMRQKQEHKQELEQKKLRI